MMRPLLSALAAFWAWGGCATTSPGGGGRAGGEGSVLQLFNGRDLTGFYRYLGPGPGEKEPIGKDQDPLNVFSVVDGMIRISGEVVGFLSTEREFDDFRLVAEVKWGQATYPPRQANARTTGIMYRVRGADEIWPASKLECQLAQGSLGNLYIGRESSGVDLTEALEARLCPRIRRSPDGKSVYGGCVYRENRAASWKDEKGFRAPGDAENPDGEWNTIEITARGDTITHSINGIVVFRATGAEPRKGRFLILSEGAELFIRRLALTPLGARAGVAVEDVTPAASVHQPWLDSPRTADHYHSVEVKALAVSDQGPPVVLVTADVQAFCREVSERIYAGAAPLGLAPHQIVLNASHDHTGPAICSIEVLEATEIERRYQSFFVAAVVRAIGRALTDMRPAVLGTADGTCDICVNRRKPPTYWLTPNPDGPIDRRVRLLVARDAENDRLRAVLALFACHPSDVAAGSIGADFLGFARDEVERQLPGVVVLTAQGAGGDVRLAHLARDGRRFIGTPLADLEPNREFGRRLGNAIVKALRPRPEAVRGPIRAAMSTVMLPLQDPVVKDTVAAVASGDPDRTWGSDPFYARWARQMLAKREQSIPLPRAWPYDIRVIRFGEDLTVAALNGEIFTCIARQIEAALGQTGRTMVLGYSNSRAAYVPCSQEIRQGGYEVEAFWGDLGSRYAPTIDELIVGETVAMARRLSKR